MLAIDADARALDTAGKELGAAIKRLADAELSYERAMATALLEIRDIYMQKGERLPAEDLRRAMAHHRIEGKVYSDYLTARAQVDALRGYTRCRESSMNGRQSILAALRDEARVA